MINTAEVDRLMKSFCEIISRVNIRIGIVRPAETASPSVFPFQVATKRTDAAINGDIATQKYVIKDLVDYTNIHKLDLASTHEPPSIAAGCILLVAQYYNIPLSKKQISDIFSISDVTISKTFRKIWPYHKIVLNNRITDLILEKKNNMKYKTIENSENN